MKVSLQNGVAVVTGGGSGIGRAVCRLAAAAGAAVAVVDVNAEAVQEVAKGIEAEGGRALALACDISDAAQVADAVAKVVATLGAPTLLFNVAGIVRYARLEDIDLATFQRVLSVNLVGMFLMSQAVLPHLVACRGSMVNVSSMAGHLGIPYAAAYCASKGGVIALTKSMAKEYADRGVRINVLAPGGVETPMAAVPFPDDANPKVLGVVPITPMGFAKAEEIARLAVFVAAGECGPLSGALIPIDGAST